MYRFKVGFFVLLSVVFWAAMLYFLTAASPQTQLALDQIKPNDETAAQLRTVSTGISWLWFASYISMSLCYWWSDICHLLDKITKEKDFR